MTTELTEFGTGTALVVGGSGGIGAAICRDLATSGSDVVLTYHSRESAGRAVADDISALGRRAEAHPLDLVDEDAVTAFVDDVASRAQRLHSVVYAAGPSIRAKAVRKISPAEWARVIQADVVGFFNLLHAVLPHFRRQSEGSLVAVLTSAVERQPAHDVLSAAPKSAIASLVRSVALEEGRSGIRANAVGPGWIDTDLSRALLEELGPTRRDRINASIPMRRIGEPREVAAAVTFLLSHRASYITGEVLCVSGGG
jgi:NAD(P)-dependent dehydrogenase (short-subunit alcohol dehydrogenase family)